VDPGPGRPAPTWRLFIAHTLPEATTRSLWAQLAPYRRRHPETRWLDPESWHLTLLFLGRVPVERAGGLIELVDLVAAAAPPFAASVAGGGGRAQDDDGVAWLSVHEGAARVMATAEDLARACPADTTLGAPPRRTPSAHLTVARRASGDVVAALRTERYRPISAAWTVDRVALLRSHLGPTGARYETLHEATLYPPAG
jgi:2'-5' RNA ligase